MGLQHRFLHEVGGIHFRLEPAANLNASQKMEVIPIDCQQSAEAVAPILRCGGNQFFGIRGSVHGFFAIKMGMVYQLGWQLHCHP